MFSRGGDERDGDFARSSAEIRTFARNYRTRNIYVAPNPTCSTVGSRHSASDVTHWSYFLIDMDPVEEEYNAMGALNEALLWLGEWMGIDFSRRQPIIIDSGRGMQAWIRLADTLLDDQEGDFESRRVDRMTARRVNGYWLKRLDERLGLIYGCRIDTSVSDLPRVMRCPGTFNVKTGRMASFIVHTDRVFTGLANRLITGTPRTAIENPEPTEGIAPGQAWQDVFVHLTRMAQVYLTQGQAEPGRHKVMWHTAKKLKEVGVTRKEALKALRWANALRGEDEELPLDQVKHALDTAYEA